MKLKIEGVSYPVDLVERVAGRRVRTNEKFANSRLTPFHLNYFAQLPPQNRLDFLLFLCFGKAFIKKLFTDRQKKNLQDPIAFLITNRWQKILHMLEVW